MSKYLILATLLVVEQLGSYQIEQQLRTMPPYIYR